MEPSPTLPLHDPLATLETALTDAKHLRKIDVPWDREVESRPNDAPRIKLAFFTADGIDTRAPAAGEVEFDCDEPADDKAWAPWLGKPTIAFVGTAGLRVIEDDDTSPNDAARFQEVPALGLDEMVRNGREKPLEWSFEDGEYQFTYMLRKRANAPVK